MARVSSDLIPKCFYNSSIFQDDQQGECSSGEPAAENVAREINKEVAQTEEEPYTILDILNMDCMSRILSYIPIPNLIASERVSKRWRRMILNYFKNVRTYKTSQWQHKEMPLTTARLRHVLMRMGEGLLKLHIDHYRPVLGDSTAFVISRCCPNLQQLKVCDYNVRHLLNGISTIESVTIDSSRNVVGAFLRVKTPINLRSLHINKCYNLDTSELLRGMPVFENLIKLTLNANSIRLWEVLPLILSRLSGLEELSLEQYLLVDPLYDPQELCEAFSHLTELRTLNLSRNMYITDDVLIQIGQTCLKLELLNVSCCNSKIETAGGKRGVTDAGVAAVCEGCPELRWLDVSYLRGLTARGARAAAAAARLESFTARCCPSLTAEPIGHLLDRCRLLTEIDLCASELVSVKRAVAAAVRSLYARPRSQPIQLWLAQTDDDDTQHQDLPNHELLWLNTDDDRSKPSYHPDLIDIYVFLAVFGSAEFENELDDEANESNDEANESNDEANESDNEANESDDEPNESDDEANESDDEFGFVNVDGD